MYADDTVLFASNKKDLQMTLDSYTDYCHQWKLKINVEKTKILCFGRKENAVFTINNEQVEKANSFKYLGVMFSRNGRFIDAIKHNVDKARKAMDTLRRSFNEK